MSMTVERSAAPALAKAAAGPAMPLSVILPNFNHGALIARALRALLDQTPPAKEIIVVDDGSTDDSVSVVEALQQRHASIRLIRHPTNRGIIAAVKSALDVATGDYVLFASSDDCVLSGLFGRALAGLTAYPQAAFFCASVGLMDTRNRVIGLRPVTVPRRGAGYLSPIDVRRAIRTTDFWVIGTATVYRRRLLAEAGYFDARLGSITDVLTNRLLAFRHGFYFDPAILAVYNKDPMSFSGRNALSATASRGLLDAAGAWIIDNLPPDVRDEHRDLFDRRMGFGLARLGVVWRRGTPDTAAIADIVNFGPADRKLLAALARLPLVSGTLVLGWLTMRLRPFGTWALIGAWWRALRFAWFRREAVQRQVDIYKVDNL
jgi:glycosyltransferase involved in cell wall biosynthesis